MTSSHRPTEYDPLPHLLALHNRADARLTAHDASQMRASVMASSFGREWDLIQATHRSHHHQEITLSHASDDHIILPVGRPLQVRLGFNNALREKQHENFLGGAGVIVIPRGMTTRWQWQPHHRTEESPRAEFLHLYLKPDSFTRIAEELGIRTEAVALQESLGVHDADLSRIGRLFFDEIHRNAAGSRLYADSLACALAVHLLRGDAGSEAARKVQQTAERPASPSLTPQRLRLALDYMYANMHRDIALADIAGVVGLSQYHFARLFRNAVGHPPHHYLVTLRIEEAKRLLRASEVSISDIAFALGFQSHSRFTAQFRRHLGVTPSNYRKP